MSSANCQYLPRFFFSIFFFRSFSLQLLIPGPYQPYHPTATAPELIALIMLHPFSYDFSNFFTLLIYSFVILRFTSFCLIPLGFNIPKYCIQSPLTSPKTQLYMKNETLLLYATYSWCEFKFRTVRSIKTSFIQTMQKCIKLQET